MMTTACWIGLGAIVLFFIPVSYTHLDVYKRQSMYSYPLNDKWIQDGYLESAAKYLSLIHI